MNIFLVAVLTAVCCCTAFANETPTGLSAGEWQDIQRQVVAARFHTHESHTGFEAQNHAHGFSAQFGEDGVTTIDVGETAIQFRLISENPKPQSITAESNTVTYQWSDNLREWWVNDENGLEQWFEVKQRPEGLAPGEDLRIDLQLETTLVLALNDNRLQLSDANTTITYDKLVVWDAGGRELPAQMALTGQSLSLLVNDVDAIYPITIDPTLSQQAYLKASNTGSDDRFGLPLAFDGNTLVVGAAFEDSDATGVDGDQSDNSAANAGAAYVFTRSGSSWNQQAYLKASNTDFDDQFGTSVAVEGDTVVVGAIGEDSNAIGVNGSQSDNSADASGAAYVFIRTGTTWTQQAYLKASNTEQNDFFGRSVAVDGDTVVVGASDEDSNATGVNGDDSNNGAGASGAAYVFHRSGTTWSQQAYLKASNTNSIDNFGTPVAIDEDTVIVGAIAEDSNATGVNGDENSNAAGNSGAAYVFHRSGSTWAQQAYLKASNTEGGDQFGFSVAIDGDTAVVGAHFEGSSATGVDGDQANNGAVVSGAAYVFGRIGAAWSQQAYLKASNTEAIDLFGRSVAVDGETVAVGAWGEDSNATGVDGDETNNGAPGSGAAYVFSRQGSTWSQQAYLKASNTDSTDQFGLAIAIDAGTVVVGAPGEDSNTNGVDGNQADNSAGSSGAAYVFATETPRRIIVTGN